MVYNHVLLTPGNSTLVVVICMPGPGLKGQMVGWHCAGADRDNPRPDRLHSLTHSRLSFVKAKRWLPLINRTADAFLPNSA